MKLKSLTARLAALLCACGFAFSAWANVAQIGETEYQTLAAAVAAVPENGASATTITMLADETISSYLNIAANKKITLDFAGHLLQSTLSGTEAPIENYGQLTLIDTSVGRTGGIAGVNRCVNNYRLLNIGQGTFNESDMTVSDVVFGGNYTTTSTAGGTAVQNKTEKTAQLNIYDCNIQATNYALYNQRGTTKIYGATIAQSNPNIYMVGNESTGDNEGIMIIYHANMTGNGVCGGFICKRGELTIHDINFVATNNASSGNNAIYAYNGAKVTINGGNFNYTSQTSQQMFSLMRSYSHTTLTINGGTFVSTNTSYPTKELVVFQNGGNGDYTLNVNGGTFTGPSSNWQLLWTHSAPLASGDSANVNGGTFNTNPESATYNWANSGVTLSSAATIIDNGNGTWTVNRSNPATGITLSCGSVLAIPAGSSTTISATLEPADATDTVVWSSSSTSRVTVDQEGNVTLLGTTGANVTATAGSVSATCRVAPLYMHSGTVEVTQYSGDNATIAGDALNAITGETGTFSNNDEYESSDPSVISFSLNFLKQAKLTTVSAGTARITVKQSMYDNNVKVVGKVRYVDVTVTRPVAKIGNVKYTTLAAAIDAAEDGDTIELIADVQLSGTEEIDINKVGTYTIDGKGHSITPAAGTEFTYHRFLFGMSGNVYTATKNYTLKNVTISGFTDSAYLVRAEGCALTLKDCTLENNNLPYYTTTGANAPQGSRVVLTTDADLTIDGCTIRNNTTTFQTVDFNTNGKANGTGGTLDIVSSLFSGNSSTGSGVIYSYGSSSGGDKIRNSTFTGNTVNSAAAAVIYFSGATDVTGCLFTGNTVTATDSTQKCGVLALGSGAADSEYTSNAFVNNTLTAAGHVATIYGGAENVDLGANYWGGNAPTVADGGDLYLAKTEGVTYATYAESYALIEGTGPGVTVTLYVPQVARIGGTTYATLEAAIDAAQSGDTIEILDGTWGADAIGTLEKLSNRDKSLTIQAASGASPKFTSIVKLGYDDSSTRNATITVKGLAFENAQLQIGNYAQTTVEDCSFVGSGDQAALRIIESCAVNYNRTDFIEDQVTVRNCTFNGTKTGVPAIRVRDSGNVLITGNTIANSNHNGILLESDTKHVNTQVSKTVVIQNNRITEWNVENSSGDTPNRGGRGIRASLGTMAAGSSVTISGNVFRKEQTGFDSPDYVKISGVGSGNTVDLSGNDWNNMLLSEVYGNSDVYTSDGTKTLTSVVTTKKEPVAQIGNVKYGSLADAIAEVPTDGTETTITMIADSVEAGTITIAHTQNVVLDLAGHTVSYTANASGVSVYFITNKGTLTVKDSGEDGNIVFTGSPYDSGYSKETVTIYNLDGTLNLQSGKITNATAGGLAYAVNNSSNAWGVGDDKETVFNMTGGVISAPNGDAALRVYQNCAQKSNPFSHNTVTISGGTILDTGIFVDNNIYQATAQTTGEGILIDIDITGGTVNGLIDLKLRHAFNTSLNITGGDFTNAKLRVRKQTDSSHVWSVQSEPAEPLVTISGGTWSFVNSANTAFNVSSGWTTTSSWTSYKPYNVTGGVFNVDLNNYPGIVFEEGKTGVANTDESTKAAYPYTVGVAFVPVATVTIDGVTTQYANLMEAINVAYNGGTVELLADVTVDHWHQNVWSVEDSDQVVYDGLRAVTGCNGLTINGNGHSLTINGIDSGSNGNQIFFGSRNLTVSNITINVASGFNGIGLKSGTISDVTFNMAGSNPAIYTSGSEDCEDGEHIEIRNCTFNSPVNSWGIYSCDPENGVDVGTIIAGNTFNTYRSVALRNDMQFLNNKVHGAKGVTAASDSTAVVRGNIFYVTTTSRSINAYPGNATYEYNVILGPIELEDKTYNVAPDFSGNYWGGNAPANLPEGVVVNSYYNTCTIFDSPAQDGSLFTLSGLVNLVTYVAQIGETQYETLGEAISEAQNGDTVVLLADVDLGTTGLVIAEGKNFTLDIGEYNITGTVNGKLITNSGTVVVNGTTGCIYNQDISAQGHDAFLNNGTATINGGWFGDADNDKTNANAINRGAGFRNFGTATINGGHFTACDNYTNGGYAYAIINGNDSNNPTLTINNADVYGKNNGNIANNSGSVTVKDGTFDVSGSQSYYSVYSYSGNTVVEGGTFTKSGNSNGQFCVEVDNDNANNPGSIAVSGGYFTEPVIAKYCAEGVLPCTTPDEDTGLYTVRAANYVAQIGSTKYETLEEAVAAVADGETIEMLKDVTLSAAMDVAIGTKEVILDLGGKTVTGRLNVYSGFVTLADTASKKGKLAGSVNVYATTEGEGYNSFTLAEGAVIDAHYGIILREAAGKTGYGTTINVAGTVKGNVWVMGNIEQGNSVINVTGTVDATDQSDVGIAINGNVTVNVLPGANITSKSSTNCGTGIEVRAGTLNVTGGTIAGNGAPADVTANGSGTTSTGAGIAVSTYDNSPITLKVTGGTITGYAPLYFANTVNKTTKDMSLVVSGGVFKTTDGGTVVIANNEATPELRAVKFVSDGYFSDRNIEDYLVEGKLCTTKLASNGLYAVVPEATVTYTLAEGAPAGAVLPAPASFTYPSGDLAEIALAVATCTDNGYTFGGWQMTDGETTKVVSALPAGTTNDVTLVATWTKAAKIEVATDSTEPEKTVEVKVTEDWVKDNVTKAGDVATPAEIKASLEQTKANGLTGLENYVLGLDGTANAKVKVDSEQGASETAMPVKNTLAEKVQTVDTGFTVKYSLDKVSSSESTATVQQEGEKQDTSDLELNLKEATSGDSTVAYYKMTATIQKTTGETVSTVHSENTIGVLAVKEAPATAIIGVPWSSSTDSKSISVNDLVRTANLTPGDELKVYDPATKTYKMWTLDDDKEWEPVNTSSGSGTSDPGEADVNTVARGAGVWLTRKNPDEPIYLVGQATAEAEVATPLEKPAEGKQTWNLVAPPSVEPVSVAKLLKDTETTDKVLVPTASVPKNIVKMGGKWGYIAYETNESGITYPVFVEQETLPAGTGFWYLNGDSDTDNKTLNW